jgi:hypothetical protein
MFIYHLLINSELAQTRSFEDTLRSPDVSPRRTAKSTIASKRPVGVINLSDQQIRNSFLGLSQMREINNVKVQESNKDIEIERLRTTCQNLNSRIAITDDLKNEVQMLERRLQESEKAR